QYSNTGRRAFLPNKPYAQLFKANPNLYHENLRVIPFANNAPSLWLLRHSAAYRTVAIMASGCLFIRQNNPAYDGENANLAAFASFYKEFGKKLTIFLMPLKMHHDFKSVAMAAMLHDTQAPLLDIFQESALPRKATAEYLMVHPPAHVYRWQAEAVALELHKRGLIDKK
ncbi:MAG TPA: hypothetical protein PLL10_06395, partial [Elusimicrobiales bacterium]|nr:hypothetical protein [Elusimicrobiales bacterium]